MTRLKTVALSALGLIIALASLGLFASVGLIVLGALAVLGLLAGVVAWLSRSEEAEHVNPKPQPEPNA